MADCSMFNFIVWGVVATILCCFGFVGNLLSLATFQRDRRTPATTLLQCLASSDFVLLLTVFVTDSLPYICDHTGSCDNPWLTWPYIRYVWFLTPISHMCSIWFVVLIALNRFFAVCRPHSLHTVWNNYRTPFYVMAALALVLLFNLPRFFEYRVDWVLNEDNQTVLAELKTEFGQTSSYKEVYKVLLVNILLVMVPIFALICLTVSILIGLHRQRRRMQARKRTTVASSDAAERSRSRAASEITFVLVVVVIVAIVCQTPLAVFHFVRYKHWTKCGDVIFYLNNISKLLVNVNCSVNFVIYCVASPKFRTVLLQILTCRQGEKVAPTSVRNKPAARRNGADPKTTNETDI